jgi:hypothetical protein
MGFWLLREAETVVRVLGELEVTETEAAKLMVHHLIIACALWEATEQDRGAQLNKIIQRTETDDIWKNAMSSFVDFLFTATELEDDPEESEAPPGLA